MFVLVTEQVGISQLIVENEINSLQLHLLRVYEKSQKFTLNYD